MIDKMKRIKELKENPFFDNKNGFIEGLVEIECEKDLKMPNEVKLSLMPKYDFGEREVEIGIIHTYYFVGLTLEDGTWEYRTFENKASMKTFFIDLEGVEKKSVAYWLNQIEELSL